MLVTFPKLAASELKCFSSIYLINSLQTLAATALNRQKDSHLSAADQCQTDKIPTKEDK